MNNARVTVYTGSYLCDLRARDWVDTAISSFGFRVSVEGGNYFKKFDATEYIPLSVSLNPLDGCKFVRFCWKGQKFDWEVGQVPQ